MNKLGDRNYALISIGAKTFGTYEPSVMMCIFEEQLYIDEVEEVQAFLQWCHDNGKAFGHGNYEERFAEFKAALCEDAESAGEEEDEYAASEKQRIEELDAGDDYAPGSGEYNDMMFGESPDH